MLSCLHPADALLLAYGFGGTRTSSFAYVRLFVDGTAFCVARLISTQGALVMVNCAIKTHPRRAFGKRPPAPSRKPKGKLMVMVNYPRASSLRRVLKNRSA